MCFVHNRARTLGLSKCVSVNSRFCMFSKNILILSDGRSDSQPDQCFMAEKMQHKVDPCDLNCKDRKAVRRKPCLAKFGSKGSLNFNVILAH